MVANSPARLKTPPALIPKYIKHSHSKQTAPDKIDTPFSLAILRSQLVLAAFHIKPLMLSLMTLPTYANCKH